MGVLFSMILEKWNPPFQPIGSFDGKTVLVTGANTGLGLETAKKIASLNAKRLIITTRSLSKGESTKKQIQQWLATSGSTSKTEIIPLVLDMSTADGVKSFVETLTSTTDRLDSAILNAGLNQPTCKISPDGFEETIQVNTVSTVHLGTLLLPLLISTADSTNTKPHLTFISSRNATMSVATIPAKFHSSPTPVRDLAQASNFPSQVMGGQARYGQSKLLLEYAIRRMSQLPAVRAKNGTANIVINSVCPGACSTDLGRSYTNPILVFIMYGIFMPLFAKSAAAGADAYLAAATAGEESCGQMWAVSGYAPEWEAVKSVEGKALGNRVWKELQGMLVGWDSSVKNIL